MSSFCQWSGKYHPPLNSSASGASSKQNRPNWRFHLHISNKIRNFARKIVQYDDIMKKIFTLVLALCSLSAWAHDFEVDGIYYHIVGKDNVEVTFKDEFFHSVANEYVDTVVVGNTLT